MDLENAVDWLIDAVEWAENDARCKSWAKQPTEKATLDFVTKADEFERTLSWLKKNRALIEAAPDLAAENELLVGKLKWMTAARDKNARELEDWRNATNTNFMKAQEYIQRYEKAEAERDALLESAEWMAAAFKKSAGDAWCAIREQPGAPEGMKKFDAAIAEASPPQQPAPEPMCHILWRDHSTGEESLVDDGGMRPAEFKQSEAQSECERLNREYPGINHWPELV